MKKNMLSVFLTILFSLVALSNASAYSIDFNYSQKFEADGKTLTSPYSWATVWDFNSGGLGSFPGAFTSTTYDTAAIFKGSMSGSAAPGLSDKTPYLAIPGPGSVSTSGYITFGLASDNTYLGLYWGSIDRYNSITFYQNGVQTLTLSGSDIVGEDANGNQVAAPSNPYVNIYGLDPFDSFKLSSTHRAFEVDNLAVGTPVPEPATMLLMGLGLVGLAGIQIKRKKTINS